MPKCSEDLWTPCIVVQKERERPQVIGEAVWAWTTAPLFVLIFILLVVLASSTCGNQHFFLSLRCADCYSIRIRDERKRLVATSPVITKRRGPSWGGQLPGERHRETAETWHKSSQPSRYMFGGKTPLRLALQKSRPHAPSVPTRSAPAHLHCKWGV